MGPIETTLRNWPREHVRDDGMLRVWVLGYACSYEALDLLMEVGGNMGLRRDWGVSDAVEKCCLADLFSEAIEAAEALGL